MSLVLSNQETQDLQLNIEKILSNKELLCEKKYQESVYKVLRSLENGSLRIVSPENLGPNCGSIPMENLQNWVVHSWVKESILLAMTMRTSQTVQTCIESDITTTHQERVHVGRVMYHDKFDLQGSTFSEHNIRALPGALAREGAHISNGAILMPSFVNIGAWVGENTMVDTWATVGSCAQIGKNVHIAGGVGIGGVLEPTNAKPVLIGDNAFIGSRCIIVEGVVISEGVVLAANCSLTLSTPIYDVTTNEKKEYRGFIPPHAIVVPGTRLKEFPGGEVSLSCCYIINYKTQKQHDKLMLNQILRSNPSTSLQTSL